MIGFAFFARGHVHDTTLPTTIDSWGALDFFREVLKKEPQDVSALFQMWAASRERGKHCNVISPFFYSCVVRRGYRCQHAERDAG